MKILHTINMRNNTENGIRIQSDMLIVGVMSGI